MSNGINEKLFHECRGIMGTENGFEDMALAAVIKHVLAQAVPVVTDELEALEAWTNINYPIANRKDSLGAFSRDLKKSAIEGWIARSRIAAPAFDHREDVLGMVSVVLPDPKDSCPVEGGERQALIADGWNACLDKVKELNP